MMEIMRRVVAVDTETGGLVPGRHALLSVALYWWDECGPQDRVWYVEVPEGREVEPGAARVNGYTEERWRSLGARPLPEVLRDVRDEMAGLWARWGQRPILLAHNAGFDAGFMEREMAECGVTLARIVERRWRCSMATLGALRDAGVWDGGCSLDDLARLIGRSRKDVIHEALEDAVICWHGYERMLEMIGSGARARAGSAMQESLTRAPQEVTVMGEGGAA